VISSYKYLIFVIISVIFIHYFGKIESIHYSKNSLGARCYCMVYMKAFY